MTTPKLPTSEDGGIDWDKLDGQRVFSVFDYTSGKYIRCRTAMEMAAAHERERCARVAIAHKGTAAAKRIRKGFLSSEEIRAEERGEDIAAEMIAVAIRQMEP